MEEISLKRHFPIIKDGNLSWYGGTQGWSTHGYVRGFGCGVIACANVLLHTVDRRGSELSREEYVLYAGKLRKHYLPVIPRFGMNGVGMAIGMNLYFLIHHHPFKARWGVRPSRLFEKIDEMLKKDIPVVLSAGPCFPYVWARKRLTLYKKDGTGYRAESGMYAHYVTVTASDDKYLTVSSWGKMYFIDKRELMEYIKKHSNGIFSSILVIVER